MNILEKQLKKRKFLMMDETRLQVLKEEGRRAQTQSFIWVVRSGEDGLPKIVLYHYTETRAGKHASDFWTGSSRDITLWQTAIMDITC